MTTGSDEVLRVVGALSDAGVVCWLEGGWGVDALLGRETRPHGDVDVDIRSEDETTALAVLAELGYSITTDQRPTRIETRSTAGVVDLHPLDFDADGNATQTGLAGELYAFPRRFFTTGTIDGITVGCFTTEAQRSFHSGYEPREIDRRDLAALDLAAD